MIRAFQWDLARQVERLDVLLGLLPRYAEWGYQELYLHLEDAVAYPSFPSIARKDAYTRKQFAKLVDAAARFGIGVVPIVNLLGHTQYLIQTEELRDLNELRASDGSPLERGQICPLHPRTLDVAEKLLRDMMPFCTTGKVHVGLDESFHLGKCPRCREDVARRGLAAHFSDHVGRLHEITSGLRLRMGLWADMLNFVPEAIPSLPRGIIAYDWYYYAFRRHPRVELYNFAESDLATPLSEHGIDYWGCPMNGAFRYEPLPIFSNRLANIRSWWNRCKRTDASGFLLTSWEAYRLALPMTTVVDAAAASLWIDGAAPQNDVDWLAQGFARVFGRANARRSAEAALACDTYPFSGYAKWERNHRWDSSSAFAPVEDAEKEEAHFARLSRRTLPEALSASIAFRRYLAARDAFVQRAASGLADARRLWPNLARPTALAYSTRAELKRAAAARRPVEKQISRLQNDATVFAGLLRLGRDAARTMWRMTRDRRAGGQNEETLDLDAARLRVWRAWLRGCRRDPDRVWGASPILGVWQLEFVVHNFAPAAQKIAVEQQQDDGSWRELAARHTIEFQAIAAQPRADIRQPFSISVTAPTDRLRICVYGPGQVAIESVHLTDCVRVIRPRAIRTRTVLGRPAPRRGFPVVGAAPENRSTLPLTFVREATAART